MDSFFNVLLFFKKFSKHYLLFLLINTQNISFATSYENSTVEHVSQWLKQSLETTGPTEIQEGLKLKAKQTLLLKDDDTWATKSLEDVQDILIPNISVQNIHDFIDDISNGVKKNPYLMNVFKKSKDHDLSVFFQQAEEKKHNIPDVLYFSIFLDNLTTITRDNFNILNDVFDVWERNTSSLKIIQDKGLLFYLKFLAVRSPLKKSIDERKENQIDPRIGQFSFPLNINIVAVYEYIHGFFDNGKAGLILGNIQVGKSKLIGDSKIIRTQIPHAKAYFDAYTTWNLGFVLENGSLPCVSKLLFPTIARYHEQPEEYLNNRIFSLMATLVYIMNSNNPDWTDSSLARLLGETSLESARHYASL